MTMPTAYIGRTIPIIPRPLLPPGGAICFFISAAARIPGCGPPYKSTTHLCSIVHFWVWSSHNSQQHISVAVCIPGCGHPTKVNNTYLAVCIPRCGPPTTANNVHISVAVCIPGCGPPTKVNNTSLF